MKPILLHYYITNRCNSRCQFCKIWHETPKTDAEPKDVFNNLKAARKAGCRFVDFTGGEPLMHHNLPEFLQEAKKLGYLTSVTTNCLLFPKRASELSDKIDLLHFSIDADTPQLHNKIRGVNSFDAVLESIEIAETYHMYPDSLFTYTNDNIDHFEGVYELALKKKLIVILDPVFETTGPERISPGTHLKALHYSKRKNVYLNKAHLQLRKNGGNHVRNPLCRAVETVLVVLPDNRLGLPCFHHRTEHINLSDGLYSQLHSDKRNTALKRQGTYSFCEGCHINCYFDPSYTAMKNRYFLHSTGAKFKYSLIKYLVFRRKIPLL